MSFIDTLKSLIGSKTDKVVEESKVKMEEAPAPVVEVMQQPVEQAVESTPEVMVDMPAPVTHMEEVTAPVDMPVDNVAAAVDQATADLESIHTENQ